MKNRDIKKLIVKEAKLAVIPDVTAKIKERLHEIPEKPLEKEVFKPRRFIEVMAFSMVLLFAITIAILFQSRETDPFVSSNDTIYEAVMVSSMSTMAVIDDITTELASEPEVVLMMFGPNDNDEPDEITEVTDNVDGVRHYLGLMESILASDNLYQYQRQVVNRRQKRFALSFKTSSMTQEENRHELSYEIISDTEVEAVIMATMTKDQHTYQSEITYQKESQTILMTTGLGNGQSVMITYHQDDIGKHYTISRYSALTMIEAVTLTYQTKEQVTLSYMKDNMSGTYEFSLSDEPTNNRRMLSIDYDINHMFRGNIEISVTGTDNDTYNMTITPNGRAPFVITRARGKGRN